MFRCILWSILLFMFVFVSGGQGWQRRGYDLVRERNVTAEHALKQDASTASTDIERIAHEQDAEGAHAFSAISVDPTLFTLLGVSTDGQTVLLDIDSYLFSVKATADSALQEEEDTLQDTLDRSPEATYPLGSTNYYEYPQATLGSDIVANGDFATDLSSWVAFHFEYNAVNASAQRDNTTDSAQLHQTLSGLVEGGTYWVTLDVEQLEDNHPTADPYLEVYLGTLGSDYTIRAVGHHEFEVVANNVVAGEADLKFVSLDALPTGGVVCEIDNITVQEITYTTVSNTITADKITTWDASTSVEDVSSLIALELEAYMSSNRTVIALTALSNAFVYADTTLSNTLDDAKVNVAGDTMTDRLITPSITVDSGNLATNTYGGLLAKLGNRVQSDAGTASGSLGATALGYSTEASGSSGATALGYSTEASGSLGATALGYNTGASGNVGATALGADTVASGSYGATALGYNSYATNDSSFVWSDGTATPSTATKQYTVYASNGIRLLGAPTEGVDAVEDNEFTTKSQMNTAIAAGGGSTGGGYLIPYPLGTTRGSAPVVVQTVTSEGNPRAIVKWDGSTNSVEYLNAVMLSTSNQIDIACEMYVTNSAFTCSNWAVRVECDWGTYTGAYVSTVGYDAYDDIVKLTASCTSDVEFAVSLVSEEGSDGFGFSKLLKYKLTVEE